MPQKLPAAQSTSFVQLTGQLPDVPSHTYVPHDGFAPPEPFASGVQMPSRLAPATAEHTSQPSLHALSQQTLLAQ